MSSQITNEFKEQFALLLCVAKINYNIPNALNHAETLCTWTVAGLITENKIVAKVNGKESKVEPVNKEDEKQKTLVAAINLACEKYNEALKAFKKSGQPGNKTEAQQEVFARCFEVNMILFPIALQEGLLDLKNAMSTAMSGLGVALGRGGMDD